MNLQRGSVMYLKRSFGFAVAACFATGVFSLTEVSAQCKPGYGGPVTVTWPNFVFVSRPGCVSNVTVQYCYTINATPYLYDIVSITLDPPCPGTPIDGMMIREIGKHIAESDQSAGFPCPICPSTTVRVGIQWASCITVKVHTSGATEIVACPDGAGACMDFYTICCDATGRTVTFSSHTPTQDCTNPNCLPVCPP